MWWIKMEEEYKKFKTLGASNAFATEHHLTWYTNYIKDGGYDPIAGLKAKVGDDVKYFIAKVGDTYQIFYKKEGAKNDWVRKKK